jgi:exodeoxyribonuclease V gamma subunit
MAWQAHLWRRLRERVATPSPAERLAEACGRLRDEPQVSDLPARIALFGLTRLPASYLDVLVALAMHRDVHLFLLHPSPGLWDRVAALGPFATLVPRADDPTASVPANPLLATWGRDAREMQLVVSAGERAGASVRHHHALAVEPATLLGRVQADVHADRRPPGEPLPGEDDERFLLDPSDRSIQVHACHGRARQVEVLRDAILHLLAEHGDLEPRDVIVMCPDIETFAPLVHATFGIGGGEGSADPDGGDRLAEDTFPDLRVRLADRSLRQTNPVLGAVDDLLGLVGGRLTASQVVDFASREPLRRRFRFDDDALARIQEWVVATGVRWGLDAAHRTPYRLDALAANTWAAGLDRLLLGVAMDEQGQRLVGGTLPLDDVDSGDIDLAGRFAELLDRLGAAVAALTPDQPLGAWVEAIAEAADALTATPDGQAWQRAELQRLLDDVLAEATSGGRRGEAPLSLAEVRALLAERLRGRPTRANFRTGHLTICTLVPMRSVPHRVVCLLGLDDDAFPRKAVPDGDDLVGREACVGDHDRRSEDRQLLLDALLAARGHLVVTYTGRDERTNEVRPPAVPLGELLDVVDATARTGRAGEDGRPQPARAQVLVQHPLQPFDARNFTTGALVADRPWSFDRVALAGARASAGPRAARPPFLPGPLPAAEVDLVELDDLVAFVQHPVKAFLRQRLGVDLGDYHDDVLDALPIELDGLQRWAVGQRLLEARLAGADMTACREAELARGHLPPGELGATELDGIAHAAGRIAAAAAQVVDGAAPETGEVDLALAGFTLSGTVGDVFGDVLRSVTYSRVAAKHRLAAWVRLLALTASSPERPLRVATVGSGRRGALCHASLGPLGPDAATRRDVATGQLALLVDLYRRGLREPLPLYCKTSAAYAGAPGAGKDAVAEARKEWETRWWDGNRWSGEDEELEHQLVLGGVRDFAEVLAPVPADGEAGSGWPDEPTRFGRYARRLWDGVLAHEEVSEA